MDNIHQANAKFRCFFDLYGIRPVEVIYEDMRRDLQAAGDDVVRKLGFSGTIGAQVSPSLITLAPQSTALNADFAARIRSKYNLFSLGTAGSG
jgi:LPS sulfotransferase NodH